jgi:hypothetical protein
MGGTEQGKIAFLSTRRTEQAMESGKRPISRRMAAKLGAVFDVPYRAFL